MNLNFEPFPSLETDRLTLRSLSGKDAQAIFDYQSNKDNFPFVDMPLYTDISEADKYIKTRLQGIKNSRWIIWAIELKESNEVVGTISIWNFNDARGTGELGYGLFKEYRGKGYMKEAIQEVVKYGFDEIHLKSVEAYTNEKNGPSRSLLDKSGFKFIDYIDEAGYSGKTVRLSIYERRKEV